MFWMTIVCGAVGGANLGLAIENAYHWIAVYNSFIAGYLFSYALFRHMRLRSEEYVAQYAPVKIDFDQGLHVATVQNQAGEVIHQIGLPYDYDPEEDEGKMLIEAVTEEVMKPLNRKRDFFRRFRDIVRRKAH